MPLGHMKKYVDNTVHHVLAPRMLGIHEDSMFSSHHDMTSIALQDLKRALDDANYETSHIKFASNKRRKDATMEGDFISFPADIQDGTSTSFEPILVDTSDESKRQLALNTGARTLQMSYKQQQSTSSKELQQQGIHQREVPAPPVVKGRGRRSSIKELRAARI
jgi:hypothetical protein